jgi:uncharacterized protein (TIGR00369 family)
MEAKTVKQSAVVMAQVMEPPDTNPFGNVHGGVIMKLIDIAAGVVAIRHSGTNAVTASIDRMDFHFPAYNGDLVTLKASINFAGTKSMEIGVRVETENLFTRRVNHTASAYLTYVALDKAGRPTEIPPLILETDEEKRRNAAAQARRESRLNQKKRETSEK